MTPRNLRYYQCLRSKKKTSFADIAYALLSIALFRLRLRRQSFRRTIADVVEVDGATSTTEPVNWSEVAKLVKAANFASLLYPGKQQCLDQAFALAKVMKRHRLPYQFCIGVTRVVPLGFHAWVEVQGEILTDDQYHVRNAYRPIPLSGAIAESGDRR